MGAQGVTKDDFDFDPHTLIPDFIGSDMDAETGLPTAAAHERGPRPRFERAKEVLRQLEFYISPGSLLESASITDKMMYLQLFRMQAMDIWTMLDKLGIPNIGEAPTGTIVPGIKRAALRIECFLYRQRD